VIAVLYEPRYGSSKVMQALADSGYPVLGEKFPAWITEDQKQWNPLGFYEHEAPLKAIKTGPGKAAIKLRVDEVMQADLPPDTRFILCLRSHEKATASQIRSGLVSWTSEEEGVAHNRAKYTEAEAWLGGKDYLRVVHEDWLANPNAQRERLLRWSHGD
jgi:hypothetical protein